MRWPAVLTSFFVPGLGHAQAGARARAIAFAAASLVAATALVWTLWAAIAITAVRIAAALDGGRAMRRRRKSARASWPAFAAAVAGAIATGGVHYSLSSFRTPSSSMAPTIAAGDRFYVERLSKAWRAPRRGDVVVFRHPCNGNAHIKRVVAVAGDTVEIRCETLYVRRQAAPRTLVERSRTWTEVDDDTGAEVARANPVYRESLDGASYEVFAAGSAVDAARGDFPTLDPAVAPPSCASAGPPSPAQRAATIVRAANARGAAPCAQVAQLVVPDDSLFVLGDNRAGSFDSRAWGVVPVANVIGRVVGRYYPHAGDVR